MASPTTPTTQTISNNIISQLEGQLSQTIPMLPKAFERVLAKALAGIIVLLYKYGSFIALQQFIRHASNEPTTINGRTVRPLTEWGRLIGIGDPTAATQAELTLTVTVLEQTGNLSAGESLVNVNTGITYQTLTSVALNATTVTVTVRAVFDQQGGNGAGAIGNMTVGQELQFTRPINVARTAVVASQTVNGANEEELEVYRQRIIDRFQARPQGGAASDYQVWGTAVAGILNIYPYKSADCPGEVHVYVEATPASSGNADGIPTNTQLQTVRDAFDQDVDGLASRRPLGQLVNTFAISRRTFNVTVVGISGVADLPAVQTQINAAIAEYMREREPFIIGLSFGVRADRVVRSGIAGLVDDIVSAQGGVFTSVFLSESGTQIEVATMGVGEKAKSGTVTYS